MPLNTSVHKTNDYDNINTNLITTMRRQQQHFPSLRKGGQQTNHERKIRNLSVNNNFVHKKRNNFFNILKGESKIEFVHPQQNRNHSLPISTGLLKRRVSPINRQEPSSTSATTSSLTKTNKSIQIPCTKRQEERSEVKSCAQPRNFLLIKNRHESSRPDHYRQLFRQTPTTTKEALKTPQANNQNIQNLSVSRGREARVTTSQKQQKRSYSLSSLHSHLFEQTLYNKAQGHFTRHKNPVFIARLPGNVYQLFFPQVTS